MKPDDPLTIQQKQMLQDLMKEGKDWNVLLFVHRRGDAPFLAPICPSLRGIEICADPSNGRYDIWKEGNIIKPGLSAKRLAKWLTANTPTEAEYMEHGEEWVEAAMKFYRIPERHNPEWN